MLAPSFIISPVDEVYREYIFFVFIFSITRFVCVCVCVCACVHVCVFSIKDFSGTTGLGILKFGMTYCIV